MDHGVTGKVVIVTGASQGIGEATARRFAEAMALEGRDERLAEERDQSRSG
jgi:NAD(P)-dependent dehydrogenase (short-subunit alcohol dehydrogenase family)